MYSQQQWSEVDYDEPAYVSETYLKEKEMAEQQGAQSQSLAPSQGDDEEIDEAELQDDACQEDQHIFRQFALKCSTRPTYAAYSFKYSSPNLAMSIVGIVFAYRRQLLNTLSWDFNGLDDTKCFLTFPMQNKVDKLVQAWWLETVQDPDNFARYATYMDAHKFAGTSRFANKRWRRSVFGNDMFYLLFLVF